MVENKMCSVCKSEGPKYYAMWDYLANLIAESTIIDKRWFRRKKKFLISLSTLISNHKPTLIRLTLILYC